jgi:hypothetical protein
MLADGFCYQAWSEAVPKSVIWPTRRQLGQDELRSGATCLPLVLNGALHRLA